MTTEQIMAQMPRVSQETISACVLQALFQGKDNFDRVAEAQCRLLAKQGWRPPLKFDAKGVLSASELTDEQRTSLADRIHQGLLAQGYVKLFPRSNAELISRERAEQAVPERDCSGQITEEWIREDFIRYVLYGAEIQRDHMVMQGWKLVQSVPIVCLCGSTRFSEEFQKAQLTETLAGKIVLTIGCNMRTDDEIFASMSEQERGAIKARLDELHLRKIDLADEVLILNRDGYIGDSTKRELEYAQTQAKVVRFLESEEPVGGQG